MWQRGQTFLLVLAILTIVLSFFIPFYEVEVFGDYSIGERSILRLLSFGTLKFSENSWMFNELSPVVLFTSLILLAIWMYTMFQWNDKALQINMLRLSLFLLMAYITLLFTGLAWGMDFEISIEKINKLSIWLAILLPIYILTALFFARRNKSTY